MTPTQQAQMEAATKAIEASLAKMDEMVKRINALLNK